MPIPARNTVTLIADAPIIQYSSGHSKGRAVGSAGAFTTFVGFYSEHGKDGAFDEACRAAGIAQIEVRHPRAGAAPDIVRHWSFGERLALYPLTAGPVVGTVAASRANGNMQRTIEAGLGLRWAQGERSKLAVRGIVIALLSAGYTGIVQLATRSHMTDALLTALTDHTRVAELADAIVNRQHHPDPVGPWELLLPLGPGAERDVGKGDTATITPLISEHPRTAAEIDREYIRAIYLAGSSPARAALQAAWRETVAWAADYASGRVTDEERIGDDVEAPPLQSAAPAQIDTTAGKLFTDDEAPQQAQPSARIAAETGAAPRARRGRH